MTTTTRLIVAVFTLLANMALAGSPSLNPLINEAQSGALLLRSTSGTATTPALLLKTDINVDVSGPVATVSLSQQFYNAGQTAAEGLYVFPLPENAAITAMDIRIDERVIVGEVREKHEAQKIYEQAKSEGKKAGLVEQRRPNMFTTAAANIEAGQQVQVNLRYTQTLDLDDKQYLMRLPLTLTPRYQGATDNFASETASSIMQATPGIDGSFTSADALPSHSNRASISVRLNTGSPLNITSSSHDIHQRYDGSAYRISLLQPTVPMDRDFLLSWQSSANHNEAALFNERVGEDFYSLITLTPPPQNDPQRLSRELIFVIDSSGSMSGDSIRQARAALHKAIDYLHSDDSFNIIEFDSDYRQLFDRAMPVTDRTLKQARRFIAHLTADGGTEMLPAVSAALTMAGNPEALRQIVFMTDGAVTDEAAIFTAVHQLLGNSRLFTVGIGSAPNSYLMRKLAQFGRGSFSYVSHQDSLDEEVQRLFQKLENPVLRDISVTLPAGIDAEILPKRIPDLYAGEPLSIAIRSNTPLDSVTVHGNGLQRWQQTLAGTPAQQHPGIASLWARRKIEQLMDALSLGGDESRIRPQVVATALQHQLVSRYTSFVAVEHDPSRAIEDPAQTQHIPNLLPHGLSFPNTALGVAPLWLGGTLLTLLSLILFCRRALLGEKHATV